MINLTACRLNLAVSVVFLTASASWAGITADLKLIDSTAHYPSMGVENVDPSASMSLTEWQKWVKDNNGSIASFIKVVPVGEVTVDATRLRDCGLSKEEFLQKAREAAAHAGANKLYMEDMASEATSGRLAGMTLYAYRVTYKEMVLPPSYLAALPYNPLPEYFVDSEVTDWNNKHVGSMYARFENAPGRDDRFAVLRFVQELKDGTPIRVALRDGSSVRGVFAGLEDDRIWVHPTGLRGIFVDRAFRPTEVQAIGVLN